MQAGTNIRAGPGPERQGELMRTSITIQGKDGSVVVQSYVAETLLSALTSAGVTEVQAPCGGKGRCGKCMITVSGPVKSVETGKVHEAVGERLLACRYTPAGDVTIMPEAAAAMRVALDGLELIESGEEGLGLAADIGTTTVAVFLYDLASGKLLGSKGERNAQRVCGADVISRITACGEGRLPWLRDTIREQLATMAEELCREANRETTELRRVSIAGNTVMEHLAAGLDPSGIGAAPFTPQSLFGEHIPGRELFPAWSESDAYLCPALSGYVGGDITAGLMSSGADRTEGLTLYVDIGTNGEMALGDKNGYLACAAAAGPAFEGAEIACGMEGSVGAIDRAWAKNGDLEVHVIGEEHAEGLCGSGLIDTVAALLDLGVIDGTGRLLGDDELPWPLAERVFSLPDGTRAFRLKDGVYLTARDIRQVQLAKAAIRAGAETLLAAKGRKTEEVSELVIAGGFGSFLDKNSALRIGLLPQVLPERIRHVGNAAGAGAALALTQEGERRLRALTERCEYLELSSSRVFMDRYIESMMFEAVEE